MDRLWDEAEEGDGAGRLFADSAILAIAAQLARQAGRSAQPEPTRGGLAPWQVRRVREYLAAHLADDVTLAELAALVHLSPAHFCRAHKQATGHSPLQSLTALRVERAKTLVADPHLPVIEVAAACGYKSPSAFAQVFRRETGMTPTEWRRRRA
jgi:AraC family transcriptional regulator